MIWLIEKIFSLGVLAAVVFFAMQFSVGGRPVKDYVMVVYRSPLIREAVRQGVDIIKSYLDKDVGSSKSNGPAMENLNDDEKKELEKLLEKAK